MRPRRARLALVALAVALLSVAAGCGRSQQAPFRIGVLTDCTGVVGETHDWSLAAAELPLLQHGGKLIGKGPSSGVEGAKVAGRRVELVDRCSEAGVYGRMIVEARRLVEVDHVDAVVGAFGSSDGMILREIARRYPTVPFLIAGSFAREATAHAPAPNLYRFSPDIEQQQAGLATYAYRTLGWHSAATVGEDTTNEWGAAEAFAAEFCALGGSVRRVWTPVFGPGGPLLRRVPPVDGVVVLSHYGAGSPVAFIRAYLARHGDAPQSLLLSMWPLGLPSEAALWPRLRGVAGQIAGTDDRSSAREAAYRAAYGKAFPGLPPVATGMIVAPYHDSVQALVEALEKTGGALGEGRSGLLGALASLRLETPAGPVRLDANRQAVAPVKLMQLDGSSPGAPSFHPIRTIAAVGATLGGLLAPGDSPSPARSGCRRATPPPWAR